MGIFFNIRSVTPIPSTLGTIDDTWKFGGKILGERKRKSI